MDHSFGRDGTHPVLRAAGVIAEALKDVRDVEPAFMSVGDRRTALVTLPVLRDQLEALWLQVIAVSTTWRRSRVPVTSARG